MEKLLKIRSAQLAQVKGELAAAGSMAGRKASVGEAIDRLNLLQELAGKFRQTQTRIEEEQDTTEASAHDYREEFNVMYYDARSILGRYIEVNKKPDEAGGTSNGNAIVDNNSDLREAMLLLLTTQRALLENQRTAIAGGTVDLAGGELQPNSSPYLSVRLPPINVPTFNGDRKQWSSFKDIYESTIHNRNDLRDSIKMQYLLSYLEGGAKQLVGSYQISDSNYQLAWTALTNYYDKKKYTVFSLIREFVEQPEVDDAKSGGLRKLVTTSDEMVRQLDALGDEFKTRDSWLIYLLLQKLDEETRALWAQEIITVDNPSLEEFLKFLDNRCDVLETCTAFGKPIISGSEWKPVPNKTVQSLHITITPEKCAKCSENHQIYRCVEFKKMDVQYKRALVKEAKLCYNCLRRSHTAKTCSSKSVCRNEGCKQRHHTLLCQGTGKQSVSTSSDSQPTNEPSAIPESDEMEEPRKVVVLPTAVVRIRKHNGGFAEVRALIDSGSESSLISEACFNKLGLPRSKDRIEVTGMGHQGAVVADGLVKLQIANRFSETSVIQTGAYVVKNLTTSVPSERCEIHPRLLGRKLRKTLADPAFYRPGSIDLILGVDVFLALLEPGQVKDDVGVPVAQNTIFGWIVSGTRPVYSPHSLSSHADHKVKLSH